MAPEMQILSGMKKATGAVLTLVLTIGLSATAEESACVKAFQASHGEYVRTHELIEAKALQAGGLTVAGAVVGVVVAGVSWRRKSWVGAIGGLGVGGTMAAGGGSYLLILQNRLKRLQSAYRIYQIYLSAQAKEGANSDEAQAFLSELGVDKQKESQVLKLVSSFMQIGVLCEGNRTLSYPEVIDIMNARLHTPN